MSKSLSLIVFRNFWHEDTFRINGLTSWPIFLLVIFLFEDSRISETLAAFNVMTWMLRIKCINQHLNVLLSENKQIYIPQNRFLLCHDKLQHLYNIILIFNVLTNRYTYNFIIVCSKNIVTQHTLRDILCHITEMNVVWKLKKKHTWYLH